MIFTDNRNKNDFNETRDYELGQNKKPVRRPEQTGAAHKYVQRRPPNVHDVHPRPVGADNRLGAERTAASSRAVNSSTREVNRPVDSRGKDGAVRNPAARQNANGQSTVNAEQQKTKALSRKAIEKQTLSQKGEQTKKPEASSKDTNKASKRKKEARGEGANTVISIVKAVVYIMFVIVISAFIAAEIIKIGNDVFAFVKSDEIIEVTVPENATTDDIAEILADNGVIKYPKIFSIYSKLRKDDGEYLAGTYSVTPMQNYDTLRDEFKPKAVSGTIDITIPEGFSTDEIIDLMVENGIGTKEGFVDVIQNGDFDYWFIKELEDDGEKDGRIYRLDGYLFPDTYQFYLASSEWTVINKLLRRFSQIFTREYRDQCEVLGYTVDEMVTLASMIEKEAASPSDFFLVSSVFHNRLKAKWTFPCFESDATVVYVIQHETGERNVDLHYDTPYNTYLYEGFPPGPISNPSASAMLAALSPQESNYYYFISNDRQMFFSETKAEHDAYIAQFAAENDD